MLAYWLLIALPIILSLSPINIHDKNRRNFLLNLVGVFYILFIGLRYETGADWEAYANMYASISWYSLSDAMEYTEVGYGILNWLLNQINADIIAVNFIAAILFVSGLVRFAKKMPNPWLALISVTPYLVIAIGMSAVRQSAAIGLVFHFMASWQDSFFKKTSLASLATSFHYSAVIALIFLIQDIKMPQWFRYVLLITGGFISYPIFSSTEAYSKYHQVYIDDDLISPGALMHVLLNTIPALIYFINIKKWNLIFGKSELIPLLAALSVLSIIGINLSSTGVDRLALYLSPIQMLVYSALPLLFNKKNQVIINFMVVMYHCTVLYWWLNYANTAIAFIPYRNVLF